MKIYLRSKVELEVMLQDNTWYFKEGTIFILEPIGWLVEYIPASYNRNSEYAKTECIRLNKVIYNKLINFNTDEYEITELEENVINPMFIHTTGRGGTSLSNYKVEKYPATGVFNYHNVLPYSDMFEEAIDYIRNEKITNLLD